MAAPKGNKFWEARSRHGRSPRFASAEMLWEACTDYFVWVEKNPLKEAKAFSYEGNITIAEIPKMRAMTLSGLSTFLDIDIHTWRDWRSHKDFGPVVTRVETIIRDQKFAGAAAELLNPNIISRDLGLADRQEHSGPDGAPITVRNLDADIDALLATAPPKKEGT